MRKFTFWLSALFLVFGLNVATAQTKVISGKVTDASGALPGVSVVVKGTTKGTQTDFDGKYSLSANVGDVLVFSFVGMETANKTVGTANVMNVSMTESALALEEVVITALGVVKKKDADLSSSTTVDTKSLQKSGESGVIQGLAGKTSGLKITKNTGDPGAGAYIQIRGQNTINGDSSPLVILDGVPISNTSTQGGQATTGGIAQQSRLNDLSADDIESVTVLKGAAAAAVWGTGAANGVLIINTKTGKGGGQKVSVSVKNAVAFDKINVEFEKQGIFGQGSNGVYTLNAANSFGDKISLRSGAPDDVTIGNIRFVSNTGKVYYPITKKNDKTVYNQTNRDAVFGDGFTWDKSVGVNFSGDQSSTFVSFSDWDQTGIIKEGSDYRRQTLRFNQNTKLNEDFTVKFNTSYSKVKSNRIQQGSNVAGLYLGYLRNAPDFDERDYKGTYYNASNIPTFNSHRGYRNYLGSAAPAYNNSSWTINEQENINKVERFTIAPELTWQIKDNMKLIARYGLDYYTDFRGTFFPWRSAGANSLGYYEESVISEKTQNFNVFVQSDFKINDDFKFNWIVGTSLDRNQYHRITGSSSQFTNIEVGDLRIFSNATAANILAANNKSETRKSGVYSVLNGEFFDQLLLELSGRYERPSTLEKNIFYPSASLGWNFSKNFESELFSFGKLRLTYGEIGIEPGAYTSSTLYGPGGITASWNDGLTATQYGNPFTQSGTLGNPLLKEERVKEFEIGTDLRFFSNKLTLGVTYYDRKTEDAILFIDVPSSTGFNSTPANAATLSNKGMEVDLGMKLVAKDDFKWNMNLNYSYNKNLVEDLSGVTSVFLNGFTGVSSRVVAGQPMATLWGGKFDRDASGKLILDTNGFPKAAASEGILGDPNPDWIGGLGTVFNYKGITLSAQFETSQGGDFWTGTEGILKNFGIHPETANENTATTAIKTYSGATIAAGTVFRGNIQDFGAGPVALTEAWYTSTGGGFGPVGELFIHDATWTRLREISLGYQIPVKYLKGTGLTNIEMSVAGRNLALWTDIEGFDPDTNLTGVSKGRGLEYFNNPSTKSYLFTLKLDF